MTTALLVVRVFCFMQRENEVLLVLRLMEKLQKNFRELLQHLRVIRHGTVSHFFEGDCL